MQYTTDEWASDRNVIDTFEEYKTGTILPDPYKSPVYYFQGDPYSSLDAFNQAKLDAAPGVDYGNIGGGGEVAPPPLMFTPDPSVNAAHMYYGTTTDEAVPRGQAGNPAVPGGFNPLLLVALMVLL